MAFVYRDHEGFRPAVRSKKQKRRPLSIQELVSRAKEEATADRDWLSECRSRFPLSLSLSMGDVRDSISCPSRSDSRLCGARVLLQGDLPRTGKLVGAFKRTSSIGLPAVGIAERFRCCESTLVVSVKTAGI